MRMVAREAISFRNSGLRRLLNLGERLMMASNAAGSSRSSVEILVLALIVIMRVR